MPAAGALQQRCPHRPRFVVPASRTTKTLRPAELTQILSTGLLGGETRLELGQIPRIIFHFPDPTSCGHMSQVNTHQTPNVNSTFHIVEDYDSVDLGSGYSIPSIKITKNDNWQIDINIVATPN